MAQLTSSYSIFSLGDSAITIDLGNCIEEEYNMKALAIHDWLEMHPFPGLKDIIMAYSSVSLFYDPALLAAGDAIGPVGVYFWLEGLLHQAWRETNGESAVLGDREAGEWRLIEIPVCYAGEFAPDLEWVAAQKGMSQEAVVQLHTETLYRVYMLGFLPGFPYLGKLDQRLQIPRKPQPVGVRAGGVGIAGMQTGIYPLNSPGGWQIIGRTPVKLFDPHGDPPVRLQAGDRVRFRSIPVEEYRQLAGRPG